MALDEAGGFLVEIGVVESAGHAEAAGAVAMLQTEFLLIETRGILVSTVSSAVEAGTVTMRAVSGAGSTANTVVIVRTDFLSHAAFAVGADRIADHGDRTMQGVCTVQNAAGATNDFHSASLFGIGFKHLVHVAESYSA